MTQGLMKFRGFGVASAIMLLWSGLAASQQISDTSGKPVTPETRTDTNQLRPDYVLGANDQILIRTFEVEEINEKPFRIDNDGNISLPLVGTVKAAGLSVQELETDLTNRYKTYVKDPHITISVIQFRAEVVFVVGAFQKPGIYPLEGRRTLVEMLSIVGGLQPNASRRIKVIRRAESGTIPLPNAITDPETKTSSVEINIASLRNNINPAEDIVLAPNDTISVERAEMVYVQGEINHTGAFELGERDSVSVLQVITLAGGLTKGADPSKAEILRPVLDTSRRAEIPVNLKQVLATRENDLPLLPNDILYIPPAASYKAALGRAALIALPIIPTFVFLFLR